MPYKEVISMSVIASEIFYQLGKRELAFLKGLADKRKIHYFSLERVSLATANLHPAEDKGHGDLSKCIYLLDDQGNLLDEVGIKPIEVKPKGRFSPAVEETPRHEETVYEALLRLGEKAEKIQFVVFFREASGRLTLYNCPEGFTVKSWLAQGCVDPSKEREPQAKAEVVPPVVEQNAENPAVI
jgi:hypothetical protein